MTSLSHLFPILSITSLGKDGTSSFSVIRVVSNTILPFITESNVFYRAGSLVIVPRRSDSNSAGRCHSPTMMFNSRFSRRLMGDDYL